MAAVGANNPSPSFGIFAPWKEASKRYELFQTTWNRPFQPAETLLYKQAKAIGHLATAILLLIPVINYLALLVLGHLAQPESLIQNGLIKAYWEQQLVDLGFSKNLLLMKQVTFVPVPGGIAIRTVKMAENVSNEFQLRFGKAAKEVTYGTFAKQIIVPLSSLPQDLQQQYRKSSPLFANFKFHPSLAVNDGKIRTAHTLALSLAHLDPIHDSWLTSRHSQQNSTPERDTHHKIPLIEATVEGLEIWFKEGTSIDFIDLIKTTFMLTSEDGTLVRPFGSYKTVIKISRDDVQDFLTLLGLDQLETLNKTSTLSLDVTVEKFLIELQAIGKFHKYTPSVIHNDPLGSLAESLKRIVPNTANVTPLVIIHPVRGIIIRLPKATNEAQRAYSQSLIKYLGYGHRDVSCTVKGVLYDQEIVIPTDKIAAFLKKPMHLEAVKEDLLAGLNNIHASIQDQWSKNGSEVRIATTVCRRLYALFGKTQSDQLARYKPTDFPETALLFPRIACSNGKMTIYFPEGLINEQIGTDRSAYNMNFMEYVGAFLGLDIKAFNNPYSFGGSDTKKYSHFIEVPFSTDSEQNRVLQLLERDLGLRELPNGCSIANNRVTCWNEFAYAYHKALANADYLMHGTLNPNGLKQRPPKLIIPDTLPQYTDAQILDEIRKVLANGGVSSQQVQTYVANINALLNRIGNQQNSTNKAVKVALRHYVYELKRSPVSVEVKKNTAISIALGAPNCLQGTQVRLVEETKRVAGTEDNARNLLLSILDEWKSDIINEILGTSSQSVHGFACHNKNTMVEETVRRINERLDEHGCVMNISAYQAETRDILRNKGFTETEIDNKIDQLFPTDEEDFSVSITEKAAIMLLTRTGLLNP